MDPRLTVLLVTVGLVLVVRRQLAAAPLRPLRTEARLGVVLAGIGLVQLPAESWNGPVAAGSLAFGLLLGLGSGLVRGALVRVWRDGGTAYRQGTLATLGVWVAVIATRVATGVLVTHQPPRPGEIFLFVGLSLATQAYVVARRAGTLTQSPRLLPAV
jgi:hypothetical protein